MSVNPLSPTASKAVMNTSVAPKPSGRFTPVDPVRVMRQYLWLFVMTGVIGLVLGGGIWYILKQYAPRYTSSALLQATGGISDPYQKITGEGFDRGGMAVVEAFIQNQTTRIRDIGVLNEVLRDTRVRKTEWFQSFVDSEDQLNQALKNLQKNLKATQVRGSTLILVEFSSLVQKDPAVILKSVIDVFLRRLQFENMEDRTGIREAFERERKKAVDDLRRFEDELKRIAIEHDLPSLKSKDHEASVAYKELADQIIKVELALQAARDSYQQKVQQQQSGGLIPSSEELADVETHPTISSRDERIRSMREQREVLLERFGESHRTVRDIDLHILAIESERDREIERLLRERQAVELERAQGVVNIYETQLVSLNDKQDELRNHIRDVSILLERYYRTEERAAAAAKKRDRAQDLLDGVRIQDERPDSAKLHKVTDATPAEQSFPPHPVVTSVGVSLLLLMGVTGIVFLREMMDQRVKSPADLQWVSNTPPLLGVIPASSEDPSGSVKIEAVMHTRLNKGSGGLMAESFRRVRTSISSSLERHGYKSLMVVGAQAGCGTSAIVHNIAISMGHSGRRVLVIDANLRHAVQHSLFDMSSHPGLTEVLHGTVTVDEGIFKTDQKGVFLMPIGGTSDKAPEVLEGSGFRTLLKVLNDQFDLIIIDVPPALLTSECYLMAKHVDATAIVIRAMADMRGMIGRMLSQFDGLQTDVLGMILNGVKSSAGGYFRKSYQAFYQYHRDQNGTAIRAEQAPKEDLYESDSDEASPIDAEPAEPTMSRSTLR